MLILASVPLNFFFATQDLVDHTRLECDTYTDVEAGVGRITAHPWESQFGIDVGRPGHVEGVSGDAATDSIAGFERTPDRCRRPLPADDANEGATDQILTRRQSRGERDPPE